jgi:hypothetical protein
MATPSILIVPDRYKSGVLYSQLPETGAVDFDVTRATPAFRTNASGVSESVASGVPRLDYPAAGGCPALLVEPAATNLVLRSEEFNDAYWTKEASVQIVSAPSVLNPRGVGSLKLEFISGGTRRITTAFAYVSGTTYTASIYAKSDGLCNLRIRLSDDGVPFTGINAEFNLINGTVISADTGLTARISPASNGFFRCSVTATASSSATRNLGFWLLNSATAGDGIFIDAAQLETGSVATSYIPTTSAAVTRNADVISKTGVSGFIGQTEGTIYVEAFIPKVPDIFVIAISNGAVLGEAIYLQVQSNLNLLVRIRSASLITDLTILAANWSAGLNKIAAAYGLGANNCAISINGGNAITATATAIPTCERIVLGSRPDAPGGLSLTDRIRAAAIYTTRLSNTDLAALTTL